MTAPEGSETIPLTVPLVMDWQHAGITDEMQSDIPR
jgi:hypothetical protein